FWLPHANIDRLWSRWLRTQPHVNPVLPQWLNEPFEFGRDQWYTKLAAKDVLDTTRAPLGYRYDDQRPKRISARLQSVSGRREAVVRRGPPERLGATRREVPLGEAPTHAEIELAEPKAAGLESFAGGRQPSH